MDIDIIIHFSCAINGQNTIVGQRPLKIIAAFADDGSLAIFLLEALCSGKRKLLPDIGLCKSAEGQQFAQHGQREHPRQQTQSLFHKRPPVF